MLPAFIYNDKQKDLRAEFVKEYPEIKIVSSQKAFDIMQNFFKDNFKDRQIVVGTPDVKGREDILKVHAKDKPLGDDVDLKQIAQTTAGFTGLQNLW